MKQLFLFMCLISLIGCTNEVVQPEKTINCTISLTNNDTVYNNVLSTVSANITTSNTDVSKIEYFIDGVSKKTLFSKPYNLDLTLSDLKTGIHTITLNVTSTDNTSKSFTKDFFFKVNLGDIYQGGVVIKLSSNKINGVIASETNLPGGLLGKFKYGAYNGDYQAYSLDDGLANTNKFDGKPDSYYAAIGCLGLVYNGYSDWYLPALNELLLFENFLAKLNIPERSGYIYWSSTESTTDTKSAYSHGFGVLIGQPCDKQSYYLVRPVRRF